jgi:hypothetical protein
MQKQRATQYKKIFHTVSWIFLVIVFAALIVYLSVHVVDLLDSDMSSEMVLAKELARSESSLRTPGITQLRFG